MFITIYLKIIKNVFKFPENFSVNTSTFAFDFSHTATAVPKKVIQINANLEISGDHGIDLLKRNLPAVLAKTTIHIIIININTAIFIQLTDLSAILVNKFIIISYLN